MGTITSIAQIIIVLFGQCLLFLLGGLANAYAQTPGCTDPQATNFDSLACCNNGSCLYASQNYSPPIRVTLPSALNEISGMVYYGGKIIALNDGGNAPVLYMLDSTIGKIEQTIALQGCFNVDWEDLAQDSVYLYVADVGNNANGNRTNLVIYKVPKPGPDSSTQTSIPDSAIYSIYFSYEDQTDFTPQGGNNTAFDCEAVFWHRGALHLVTKNWKSSIAKHYMLPDTPGTYKAILIDSFDTGGFLITGATVGGYDELMLTGYNMRGGCSLFLAYGFDSSHRYFTTGSRRHISLPSALSMGQLEAACFVNGVRGFLSNERFTGAIFPVPARLRTFTTWQWIIDYYKNNTQEFATPGMLRYNTTTNKYEVYDGIAWKDLN
jgi:hypothetical protein